MQFYFIATFLNIVDKIMKSKWYTNGIWQKQFNEIKHTHRKWFGAREHMRENMYTKSLIFLTLKEI